MPIEQIALGDEVWAADPEIDEAGARPVTALIEGEGVKDLVTVSTASGSAVATAGHPFWSVSDAAWVDAGDLAVGDAVLQAGGATGVVTAVSEVSRQAVVHNLTVADLHTYFVVVGDAPTLVHNSSCGGAADDLALANQHVTNSGETVLGSYPGYIAKAETRGASYFDLGDAWDESRGWELNVAFLSGRVAARDTVLLSIPSSQVRAGSYLARELDYLTSNGYRWVNQWALRPSGQ